MPKYEIVSRVLVQADDMEAAASIMSRIFWTTPEISITHIGPITEYTGEPIKDKKDMEIERLKGIIASMVNRLNSEIPELQFAEQLGRSALRNG